MEFGTWIVAAALALAPASGHRVTDILADQLERLVPFDDESQGGNSPPLEGVAISSLSEDKEIARATPPSFKLVHLDWNVEHVVVGRWWQRHFGVANFGVRDAPFSSPTPIAVQELSEREDIVGRSLPVVLPNQVQEKNAFFLAGVDPALVETDIGPQFAAGCLARDVVGLTTLADGHQKRDEANRAQPKRYDSPEYRPVGPVCRVSSGTCGIPLGAKVGLVVVLAIAAWGVIFRGFGLLGGPAPTALRSTLYCCGGMALIGIAVFVWGQGGLSPG